jgi:hypothetical protein
MMRIFGILVKKVKQGGIYVIDSMFTLKLWENFAEKTKMNFNNL